MQNSLANATTTPENFGAQLGGDSNQQNGTQLLYIRRAYLEWASDWGIFKFGRQPKSWGLGILYDAGNEPLNDFGTTVDRAGFQAMLGNLDLSLGYEKGAEGSVNTDHDDIDTFELSMEYTNSETLFDVGILYARNVRSAPSPTYGSSHDISIFLQKKWDRFQLGGEFVSIRQDHRSDVFGGLAQIDWTSANGWNLGLDGAVSTAGKDSSFNFHQNYQPFLILFRQNTGLKGGAASVRGGTTGASVGTATGDKDGAGAMLAKATVAYAFPKKIYKLGVDFGTAQFMRKNSSDSKNLGIEFDTHFSHKWYDNFTTYYTAGMLFPGSGLGSGAGFVWGGQIRGALVF